MSSSFENMNEVLNLQKKKFINDGPPSIELRIDRLNRLKSMLIENRYELTDALSSDFGSRSKNASLLSDVYTVLPEITNAIKNIKMYNFKTLICIETLSCIGYVTIFKL